MVYHVFVMLDVCVMSDRGFDNDNDGSLLFLRKGKAPSKLAFFIAVRIFSVAELLVIIQVRW